MPNSSVASLAYCLCRPLLCPAEAGHCCFGGEFSRLQLSSHIFSVILGCRLVWRDTTKVGCSISFCPQLPNWGPNFFLVVCRYSPSGNIAGQFQANVLPLAN